MSTTGTPARLEWWANSRTRLGVIPVGITPVGEGVWEAAALGESDAEREADLLFLIDTDPNFLLRIDADPDATTVEVTVTHEGDLAHLTLRAAARTQA